MRLEAPALLGVISDTHGELHEAVSDVFAGVDLVIHAGDIGTESILAELELLAPVVAVRGNTDEARWAETLPSSARVRVGATVVEVAHDPCAPAPPDADVVVRGHTHRPRLEALPGVLHVNPGSASRPRTQRRVPTVALLALGEGPPRARIVELV